MILIFACVLITFSHTHCCVDQQPDFASEPGSSFPDCSAGLTDRLSDSVLLMTWIYISLVFQPAITPMGLVPPKGLGGVGWGVMEVWVLKVNASSAHIESESSAHIANESSAHRETASSAHKERSSAHIEAGNQPFRVWFGGVGGWGGVG